MNSKARSNRAMVAMTSLILAGFILADMLGNARVGADYLYPVAVSVVAVLVSVSVALFTWNVVAYARR